MITLERRTTDGADLHEGVSILAARSEPLRVTRSILISLTLVLAIIAIVGARTVSAQRAPDSTRGRIVIELGESYASAGRTRIQLHAGTGPENGCFAPLAPRVVPGGDTVVVDRWRREDIERCEPAGGTVPLPWDAGSHVLVIKHLGATDRYRVTITGTAIHVAPIGVVGRASLLGDKLVWRFPRESFAVNCGTAEHEGWMCAELFRMLARRSDIEPIDFPLAGRNPFGDRFGDYGLWHNDAMRYFRTKDPLAFTGVRRDVDGFYGRHVGRRNGYGITLIRWTGERWFPDSPRDGVNR